MLMSRKQLFLLPRSFQVESQWEHIDNYKRKKTTKILLSEIGQKFRNSCNSLTFIAPSIVSESLKVTAMVYEIVTVLSNEAISIV